MLNNAYVAFGLLYGGRDFGRTIEISTRAGQDSDCNPSSAGGILGVMLGYEVMPETWRAGQPAISTRKFSYTDYSFENITRSAYNDALKSRGRGITLVGPHLTDGGHAEGYLDGRQVAVINVSVAPTHQRY